MIEALKNDDIIEKVGGRFKLTSLIQRRWLELMRGARPLVDPAGRTEMEVVIEEILQGKVSIDYAGSKIKPPGQEDA
jgi:DNA-directed RNA polymerase subunit omega